MLFTYQIWFHSTFRLIWFSIVIGRGCTLLLVAAFASWRRQLCSLLQWHGSCREWLYDCTHTADREFKPFYPITSSMIATAAPVNGRRARRLGKQLPAGLRPRASVPRRRKFSPVCESEGCECPQEGKGGGGKVRRHL